MVFIRTLTDCLEEKLANENGKLIFHSGLHLFSTYEALYQNAPWEGETDEINFRFTNMADIEDPWHCEAALTFFVVA